MSPGSTTPTRARSPGEGSPTTSPGSASPDPPPPGPSPAASWAPTASPWATSRSSRTTAGATRATTPPTPRPPRPTPRGGSGPTSRSGGPSRWSSARRTPPGTTSTSPPTGPTSATSACPGASGSPARSSTPKGKPVRRISVTTPSVPDQEGRPNFNHPTEADGSFRTDELPPGRYLARVGAIHEDGEGKDTGFAFEDAPGIYLPVPLTIRADGRPEPAELILRPSEDVRFAARLATTRPAREEGDRDPEDLPDRDDPAGSGAGLMMASPIFTVRGRIGGLEWSNAPSFAGPGKVGDAYSVRVPKGLEDATLEMPFVPRRFRPAPGGPELFGPAFRLGRVDADRGEIRLRRFAATTLKVHLGPRPPEGLEVEARYAREPEMEAAGVFKGPTPPPIGTVAAGNLRFAVIPDEEVEIRATAPGLAFGPVRAKLAEGETREVTPAPKP